MVLRGAKIGLAACMGVVLLLVGVDNLLDYQTNFEAVRHIMSMDTLPSDAFAWRAVTSPALHHLVYWLIIATEIAAAALTFLGCFRLYRVIAASAGTFNAAKATAVLGLSLALALYLLGFLGVAGEWFEMWRSTDWNMQQPAFRFVGSIGVVLIFLAQRDDELRS